MKQKLKKQDTGFTQIKNSVLADKKLSIKAKGLFAYLYSKPNDWDFRVERIAQDSKDGRDLIISAIKELEDNDYLTRKRLSTGRMIYYIYFDKKPNTENPTVEKSHSGKIALVSNKDIKIIKNKKITKTLSAEADEEFNLLKEIIKMLKDKQKHIQIIGIWLKAKNPKIENKKQIQSFIKRNLRPAKLLEGYSTTRIIEVMKWLKDNADFKWTLETVGKYIDEDLNKLEPDKILTIK